MAFSEQRARGSGTPWHFARAGLRGRAAVICALGALWALLPSACRDNALEPERPADPAPEQRTEPATGGPSLCDGERWAGPAEAWVRARCSPIADGQFRCECSEQTPETFDPKTAPWIQVIGSDVWVAGCKAALRDQCDIDADAPVFCSLPQLGTCWPRAGGEWTCECGAGIAHASSAFDACSQTLWARCGERCETPFGECSETAADRYQCQCTGLAETLPRPPAPPPPSQDGTVAGGVGVARTEKSTCADAMATYCGARCESSAGRCEPTEDGFSCACNAGGSGTLRFTELGGISPDACGNALQRTCGQVLLAPLATCSRGSATCEALPRVWPPGAARPESFEYACRCERGGAKVDVEARTCDRAMFATCPSALASDALLAPADARQMGATCAQDGDCVGGICHLGRRAREGVCSASCKIDADCPSGGLCAFAKRGDPAGRCFLECGQEYACDFVNDAFDDPLHCADPAFLPFGRLLRDDESGQICAPISDAYSSLPVRR